MFCITWKNMEKTQSRKKHKKDCILKRPKNKILFLFQPSLRLGKNNMPPADSLQAIRTIKTNIL